MKKASGPSSGSSRPSMTALHRISSSSSCARTTLGGLSIRRRVVPVKFSIIRASSAGEHEILSLSRPSSRLATRRRSVLRLRRGFKGPLDLVPDPGPALLQGESDIAAAQGLGPIRLEQRDPELPTEDVIGDRFHRDRGGRDRVAVGSPGLVPDLTGEVSFRRISVVQAHAQDSRRRRLLASETKGQSKKRDVPRGVVPRRQRVACDPLEAPQFDRQALLGCASPGRRRSYRPGPENGKRIGFSPCEQVAPLTRLYFDLVSGKPPYLSG